MDEGTKEATPLLLLLRLRFVLEELKESKGRRGGAAQFPWELQQMLPLHGLNETFTCQQQQKRPEQQFNPWLRPPWLGSSPPLPSLQGTWAERLLGNFQYGSNILVNWAESEAHSNRTSFFLLFAIFCSSFSVRISLSLFRWKGILIYCPCPTGPGLSIFYDCRAVQLQQLSTLCASRWRDTVSATWPRRSCQFPRKRDGFGDSETVRQRDNAPQLPVSWQQFEIHLCRIS